MLYVILAVLAIILIILSFKMAKNIFMALMFFVFALIIIAVLFGTLIFFDVKTLFFSGTPNIYLIHETPYLLGVSMTGTNTSSIKLLPENELLKLNLYYATKDFKKMAEGYGRLFIFQKGILWEGDLPNDISGQGFEKTLKDSAFGISTDPLYLIKQYRQGNITVYPDTLLLRILKY